MSKCAGLLLGLLFPFVATAETVTITSPSPAAGQFITNGCIQVYALAQSDVGASITNFRVYVDDKDSGFSATNIARINTKICVPAVSIGNHSVFVRAWSSTGASGSSTAVNVT